MINQDTELLGIWREEIKRGIRESRAFGLALFSVSGDVLYTNAAIASLVGERPAMSFVNPTFDQLLGMPAVAAVDSDSQGEGAGLVFSGFITLKKESDYTSICARVYLRDSRVLVVGEIDVTSLSREYQTVVELNRENNRLQRDLMRQKHVLSQEVEQRKRSEARVESLLAQKEVILREVHHRIKNNMHTVVSMLQLQDRIGGDDTDTTGSVLRDAAQRISSMMLLYDKLYHSVDLDSMDLDGYLIPLVEQIISIFPHGASIQLYTEVAPIKMKPKLLSELGIIVYEVVSNAMKYALADRSDGCLTVTAHHEGATVTLSIADNGPGLPENYTETAQPGFGMTLVNALADQIDGTIRFENDNGTRFILDFDPGESTPS